ncbi:hypothetical protein GCM10008965_38880 [Methylorubrum aminovorans]|nr:hypothetical protein GCM10025880_23100 [Methylorubrum aminovorans]
MEYTIEKSANGYFIVKVGEGVAGYVSEDVEHPGLWVIEDADGHLMGRHHDRENGAAFLATWFGAEVQNWS